MQELLNHHDQFQTLDYLLHIEHMLEQIQHSMVDQEHETKHLKYKDISSLFKKRG